MISANEARALATKDLNWFLLDIEKKINKACKEQRNTIRYKVRYKFLPNDLQFTLQEKGYIVNMTLDDNGPKFLEIKW